MKFSTEADLDVSLEKAFEAKFEFFFMDEKVSESTGEEDGEEGGKKLVPLEGGGDNAAELYFCSPVGRASWGTGFSCFS